MQELRYLSHSCDSWISHRAVIVMPFCFPLVMVVDDTKVILERSDNRPI